MSKYKLSKEIVALSEANTWYEAKLEWLLDNVYEAEEPETCLCGHFPIIEICVLRNKENHNSAVVGNCCVKKFIGLPSNKIFQAYKRVRKDDTKSVNAEALEHAYGKHWISDWEIGFYFDIMRKRNLSVNQARKKKEINTKLAKMMKKAYDRTPAFEHGAMWEIEHIRPLPLRTQQAVSCPVSGAV